jgi:hypothetical protein
MALIQSVLYPSPYSGCKAFSGWAVTRQPQAPGAYWPPQTFGPSSGRGRNAPGAILSVDSYRPGWAERRVSKSLVAPGQLPPRAILTLCTPTQKGKFTIQGPSTAGPWTTYSHWDELGTDEYGSASHGAGHNFGLG